MIRVSEVEEIVLETKLSIAILPPPTIQAVKEPKHTRSTHLEPAICSAICSMALVTPDIPHSATMSASGDATSMHICGRCERRGMLATGEVWESSARHLLKQWRVHDPAHDVRVNVETGVAIAGYAGARAAAVLKSLSKGVQCGEDGSNKNRAKDKNKGQGNFAMQNVALLAGCCK